ncbi:T9SS type A sorting domain-containing protein [Labilibacter marinus]|uniref:T9SS type A sorting domain-containing protein n=1 Tax=Labilibacter marinus TaxID=1477105 RepID=UPI0009502BD8|nr:T9SS type A sorting domain-containing protein [Labilibacter marinus]
MKKFTGIQQKAFVIVVLLFAMHMANGQNYPMSDPRNSGNWILNENISDEFNGTELDKSKWWILGENNDYRSKWKGRAPGQFAAHNVKVENGNLVLMSRWDPDFNFANETNNGCYYGGTSSAPDKSKPITQACVMSETFIKYGYMEIRCKAADAPVTSSFWTTGYHGEIDMTENYGKRPIGNPENRPEELERKYRTNLISWDPDKAPDHEEWKVEDVMDVRMASDFYVFGFEWDKNYMKTYFNGELVRYVSRQELEANDQWKYQYPHEIWLNSEVFSWYGLPSEADLATPAEYQIDYVRVWQRKVNGPSFNALGFEGPFYFQGRSIGWWNAPNAKWRMKDEKASCGEFSLRYQHEGPFSGNYSTFSPYGSLDLPSGENEVEFKIWIDPSTDINKLDMMLANPWKTLSFDLTGVSKGEWVEVSQTFSRNAASNPSLSNGDRIQITLRGADVNSAEALFYIDDIRFNDDSDGTECPACPECSEEIPSKVEANLIKDMRIYPNPAEGMVHVSSDENGVVQVYNHVGVLVKSVEKESTEKAIDVSHLTKGMYFVKLTAANKYATQKVMIN